MGCVKQGDTARSELQNVAQNTLKEIIPINLFVNFFHGNTATENCSHCQVSSMSGIACSHHVFSIKHLLGQFWYSQRSVLLATTGCQWGESGHEKVKPGEGNHVDCQFSQICVQLTGEPQTSGDT